jgi:hypothetical protein
MIRFEPVQHLQSHRSWPWSAGQDVSPETRSPLKAGSKPHNFVEFRDAGELCLLLPFFFSVVNPVIHRLYIGPPSEIQTILKFRLLVSGHVWTHRKILGLSCVRCGCVVGQIGGLTDSPLAMRRERTVVCCLIE